MPSKTKWAYSAFLAVLVTLWASRAHAYLDPGAGSYALQIIVASLLGAAFFLKTQWHRVKSFLARLTGKENNAD